MTWNRRIVVAGGIVLVMLAALAVSGLLASGSASVSSEGSRAGAGGQADARGQARQRSPSPWPEGYDPEDNLVLELYEKIGSVPAMEAGVAQSIAEEACTPEALEGTWASNSASVSAVLVPYNRELAARRVQSELSEHGWQVPQGAQSPLAQGSASYVKESGRLRWLYVSITEFADSCLVMLVGGSIEEWG